MLEIVTTLPAVEITNINDVTEKVDQYLQKYSLIVSVDDVPVAKKMVTEINSIIKEIDNARKSKVQELQAPIKMFEMQIRDLSDMCTQKKNELQGQIKVFEDQKKVEIRTLLDEELRVLYLKHGVDTEYQTSNTSDLVILSNINPKGGTLTKKAKDTLVERVLANKQWQDKINKRLELLPTLSIQYGLKSAMTRFDVEYFLKWESDEQFQEKLTTSFKRAAEKEQEIIPAPPPPISQTPPPQKPAQTSNGLVKVQVTATFEVEIEEKIFPQLEEMLIYKFARGGFKQVPIVETRRM